VESNDPASISLGPVRLVPTPDGLAYLIDQNGEWALCGPAFAQLAPESLRRSAPCGA
jgi:hypothetical protein